MYESPEPVGILRRRVPTAIAALLAIGLLAAACGSEPADEAASVAALPAESEESALSTSDDGDADIPASPEDVSDEDAEAAQLQFDQCMTDNGVDQDELFGDVDTDSGDGETFIIDGSAEGFEQVFEAYEAALEECEPILEAVFGDFELTPEQEAELADAEAKFNQCMADAGFEMTSPEGNDEAAGFELDADMDIDDLQAAADECGEVYEEIGSFGSAESSDQ